MSGTYTHTRPLLEDLEETGQLLSIQSEVNPHLEMAEIQRQVYSHGGPALWFRTVKGSRYSCASNIYGTLERAKYIFRSRLDSVKHLMAIKENPANLLRASKSCKLALQFSSALPLPKFQPKSAPVFANSLSLSDFPQIVSWPGDGGPFITLPQVCSVSPKARLHPLNANLGMYRVQIAGNNYQQDELGLHYQIHRGIGVHHAEALAVNKKLTVSIFVGGPPSHALSAVMPLPEGLPELAFAGLLAGRSFRYSVYSGALVSTDADFCIIGEIEATQKPEGPFGDHLGYYSLQHPFPFMKVKAIFARKDAVWPFTVVGRPPQEDSVFGALIHELTGVVVKSEIPGVSALHAVDACGVHPLLFALGSERYRSYVSSDRPEELLTQSMAILGFGQCSLAKYLLIADDTSLNIHNESEFICGVLARAEFRRDLHFITKTSVDTLDYSGEGLNEGSKLILAARGPAKRKLISISEFEKLECRHKVTGLKWIAEGILVSSLSGFTKYADEVVRVQDFCNVLANFKLPDTIRLIVIVDDPQFCAQSFKNFLWVTFTRSDPSRDVHGIEEFYDGKHWGCRGPLVIDARIKPHHAPPLIEDPAVLEKVRNLKKTEKKLAPYLD